MRRKERQLSSDAAQALLKKGEICHLAMSAQDEPYLVTLNYGYRDSTMYYHCAQEGKKVQILAQSPRVCFTVVQRYQLKVAEQACDFSAKYESVVGCGTARFLGDREEKRRALEIIMAQYSSETFAFPDRVLDKTAVFAIDIEELSAKSSY